MAKKGGKVVVLERGRPVAIVKPYSITLENSGSYRDPWPRVEIEDIRTKTEQFKQANSALERTKAAQRGRDALLKGVNRKS